MTTDTSRAFLEPEGLLRLMSWLSPAFPVGGFSYSHGIETAVEAGLLTDRATVEGWIATILGHGAGWTDAVLFRAAHRAVIAPPGLETIVELAGALRGTSETALEAQAQGTAFLAAVRTSWPQPQFETWLPALGPHPSYAMVVAVAAASAGIGETAALTAFLHGLAATLISAAVRLVPLGQTDGQRALRALAARIPALIARARVLPLEDLGAAAPMVEWTSMRHETQYTRLFRS